MKKFLLICLASCFTQWAMAQKVFFLYLQSDDQSPFYIRMGDKIHSSASSGYLILSNLTDSIYHFGLGFAKSAEPEAKFSVAINQDDKGYIIKKFNEGLALFDFRDLSIVKANSAPKENIAYKTTTDPFSSVLSKAANDPTLLKVPIPQKEDSPAKEKEPVRAVTVESEKPISKPTEAIVVNKTTNEVTAAEPARIVSETIASVSNVDTLVREGKKEISRVETIAPEINTEPAVSEGQFTPSVITRHSESSTTEGFGLVYFDKTGVHTDTIRIVIPPSKVRLDDNAQAANLSEIEKGQDNTSSQLSPEKTIVKLDGEISTETKVEPQTKPIQMQASSTCIEAATDKDFMKLRKKMAAEVTDEAMISEAKKVFRSKCFSVEQLRYLSTLFLTSAAKYQFFDAAYQYVLDRQNFSSLQAEIKDEYYLKRFKALIGE